MHLGLCQVSPDEIFHMRKKKKMDYRNIEEFVFFSKRFFFCFLFFNRSTIPSKML